MYGKIFDSMYEGTLYGHWQAIVTMQQLIVLCNADGIIDMTPQAIAARTSIPLEIIKEGLRVLSEPDNESRTPGSDGRRIELIDSHRSWGWVLINHQKYKMMVSHEEKREADRVRIAGKRKAEKDSKNSGVAECRKVSQSVAEVAHADTDTDTDTNTSTSKTSAPLTLLTDLGVDEQVAKDWIGVRKAKRAGPVTDTVVKALQREADAAGISVPEAVRICAERGWQGFKAEWMKQPTQTDQPSQTLKAAQVLAKMRADLQ